MIYVRKCLEMSSRADLETPGKGSAPLMGSSDLDPMGNGQPMQHLSTIVTQSYLHLGMFT